MTTTVDSFLDKVKRRITVPSNQVLLDNDNMLSMADDVTREQMVPLIMSVNQNYFVVEETIPVVTDQTVYDIPYRSIGRGLRDLKMQQGSDLNAISSMSLIALEDAHRFGNNANPPLYFYFRGDKIVLVPVPQSDDYQMICFYNLQPSRYIQTTDAALVVSIVGAVVTCSDVPTTMTSGVEIDFIQGKSGCSILDMDVAISSATSTTITFASADDIPDDLVAGDYISLAGTSPVIQMPDEAVPLLECWTAERICYAIGDFDGAQVLVNRAQKIEENLKKVLTPRIEGAQTKIVNRMGLLRGQGFNTWRYRGGYNL